MGLDESKLDALRRWGQGLRGAGSEEQAAAGRAILMLVEEIERLRLELLRTREELSPAKPKPERDEAAEDTGRLLTSTLQERLQRALRRGSDPSLGSRPELAEETGQARRTKEESLRQRLGSSRYGSRSSARPSAGPPF